MAKLNYRRMVTTLNHLQSGVNKTDGNEAISKIPWIITHGVFFVKIYFLNSLLQ